MYKDKHWHERYMHIKIAQYDSNKLRCTRQRKWQQRTSLNIPCVTIFQRHQTKVAWPQIDHEFSF